jgi:hypothetical protein
MGKGNCSLPRLIRLQGTDRFRHRLLIVAANVIHDGLFLLIW